LQAPTAAELPATRVMLGAVRTELLERIDQTKHELKAEIQEVKAEIQEVRAEVHALKGEVHDVKAGLHGLQAAMARITLLFEEQNARNKIVLDALSAFMDRQMRIEQRMDAVEETVRSLAAARAAG
jgi:chromosome segregation ATPase